MKREDAIRELTAEGAPFELVQGEMNGRTYRMFKNVPATLRDLYENARSDAEFIVYEDERISFEEAWQRACDLAHLLVDTYGVKKGDRVAISLRNYPEWSIAFMAASSIGAIVVALNALWKTEEMEFALSDSRPTVAFFDQERLDRFAPIRSKFPDLDVIAVRPTKPLAEGQALYPAFDPAVAPTEMPDVDMHPHDDVAMLYTSGSTGHPKGAVSNHLNILTGLMAWELDGATFVATGVIPQPDPTNIDQPAVLLCAPLFHAAGSHAVLLASFRAQRRMVCMYKWDVKKGVELIEKERIIQFIGPAAITGDLVEEANRTNCDLSSLLRIGGGGEARAPEQVKAIDATFPNGMPTQGWGMTETSAIGTGIVGADYLKRPSSSGCMSPIAESRIVDEEGNVLDVNQRGELQVRGAHVIAGYWERPEANAATFDGDWLKTGDVAYFDEEGYLFIVDRIKDLVIRGGENIGCGSVEAALMEHPDILEVSVYGVPDPRLGEEVGTTIYATKPLTQEEVKAFVEPRLAAFEVPRYMIFSEEPLPRIAAGKIFKRQLRDEAVEALGLRGPA